MFLFSYLRYWIREGDYAYPTSCREVMKRSFAEKISFSSGIYKIEPKVNTIVSTVCDFDRHGGGWTLVTKSSTKTGWNKESTLTRNVNNAKSGDYSIFGLIDDLKHNDAGEVSKQQPVIIRMNV